MTQDHRTDKKTPEEALALKQKKRRLERILIGFAVLVILGLTFLQSHVVRLSAGVPKTHSLLIFALINANVILLLFLLVLVLRNLYKIFFEQHQLPGGQLRTKLIIAFVSLSLVPTILIFYAAFQFITIGHDYWFDKKVEQSLVDSLVLAQFITDVNERFCHDFGDNIRRGILEKQLYEQYSRDEVEKFLLEKRREYHLSLVEVYSPDRQLEIGVKSQGIDNVTIPPIPAGLFTEATTKGRPRSWTDAQSEGDLVRVVWPIVMDNNRLVGYLVAGYRSATPIQQMMRSVEEGLESYRDLKRIHDPVRVSHYIALTIVALLSVFVSTWIGFHLAKGITGPIMDLADGTERIAHGDYDFTIDVQARDGEIGTLVDSFNRMTRDLKAHKSQLTEKNIELLESNRELDQRRRYMEIILKNVTAGVISLDAEGKITTINHSAEAILNIKANQVLGRSYVHILGPEHEPALDRLIRSAASSPKGTSEKQIKLRVGEQGLSLHLHLTVLKDENGQDMGLVLVFDDLSEVEKAQRMAAWREVARRIAHEIKNPLTPIHLSAQRLRKRYGERFAADGQLFDECTLMIIRQVDELKRLVSEFSNFARMPEIVPTPNDLAEIVDETVILYHESQKEVEIVFNRDPDLPVFNLDREQMKRVLINLLDNAVAAVESKGRIEINLSFDKALKMVRLEVADNGVGITPTDKDRLFEPYFSTKKSGTGLGLAIVKTIVTDHDGFVRVQDQPPQGTRFIIELPIKN